jgi:hypothetical protein
MLLSLYVLKCIWSFWEKLKCGLYDGMIYIYDIIMMNEDIIFNIVEFLDIKNVMRCSKVNKLFNKVCNYKIIWKRLNNYGLVHYENDYYGDVKYNYGLKKFIRLTYYRYGVKKLYFQTELEIVYCRFNKLPLEIGLLKNLKRLILDDNNLVDIPREICQLSNLKYLSIAYNKIKTFPIEICQLSNLKYLYLHDNQLTVIPPEISNLNNLTYLTLNNNKLKTLPIQFGQFKKIEMIRVDYNIYIPKELDHINIDFFNKVPNSFAYDYYKLLDDTKLFWIPVFSILAYEFYCYNKN